MQGRRLAAGAPLQHVAPAGAAPGVQVAATCNSLAAGLYPDAPVAKGAVRPKGGCMALFGRSWKETRANLQTVMGESVRGYLA